MSRPIRAVIDRAALRHNFRVARRHAGGARLWAVVKADAYGHGLDRTVAALRAAADAPDGFALIELERAVRLRASGLDKPLLMLEGFYAPDELPWFVRHRLIPVLHRADQVTGLLAAGWPADLPVYLKIDSGMHRLGFDAAGLAAAKSALAGRRIETVLMTHFADADGPRGIDWQMERFAAMTTGMNDARSLGNSATILRFPDQVGDWARPGIMLYGGSPFADVATTVSAAELDLRPVMTLQSEIIAVQELAPGESVGYGCTFTAGRPMRVGIVACGYADGYPRHAPTGTPVLVEGMRTRTLGRVSMDKLCVDLTDLPTKVGAGPSQADAPPVGGSEPGLRARGANQVGVGGTATLWGCSGETVLAADEVAAAAGTICYELFCALAPRVPVVEVG